MSKQSNKTQAAATFTGKAVTMRKEADGILAVAVELDIVDGLVVGQRPLNAPDLPVSAAGQGSRSLWAMFQGVK